MSKRSLTYKDAGVDVVAGDEFVKNIEELVRRTHNKYVKPNPGGFAGMFDYGSWMRDRGFSVIRTQAVMNLFAAYLLEKYGEQEIGNETVLEEWYGFFPQSKPRRKSQRKR